MRKHRILKTLAIILAMSNLVSCSGEMEQTSTETTKIIEVTQLDVATLSGEEIIQEEVLTEEIITEEKPPIEETEIGLVQTINQPELDAAPIEEFEQIGENIIATTKNIEFTFHETEFKPLKQVPLYMVEYFPADENGNLTEGFYAIFTTISYKNLSNESQTFMTNSTTIRSIVDDEPSSLIHEMRYFSKIDNTKKLSMQYTLAPLEEVTFDVAFCIADTFYPLDIPKVIVINPDGTNPINENARVIPISLSL